MPQKALQLYAIHSGSDSREHSEQGVSCRQSKRKWLTDVTEFKWYDGPAVHKIYLSAILDLYDRRIVAYKIGTSNNNKLVFDTFDEAIEKNPNAHPLVHSDRGFQYTSKHFRAKLDAAKMVQSMSRVGRCIGQWSDGRILGNSEIRDVLI